MNPRSIIPFLLTGFLFITVSCGDHGNNESDTPNPKVVLPDPGYKQTSINDLVLIYQGGVHRLDWTREQLTPYVVHTDARGKRDWFFDGFLFFEFKDGKGRGYASRYDDLNARKEEWSWLIDRHFEENKALSALNTTIQQQILILGEPPRKHQVVLGLPEPIPGQKDWGELNGQVLDFSNDQHRLAACRWYIDELMTRFFSANYQYIELVGFYWISEDMKTSQNITVSVGSYIRQKNRKFFWIPYWNAYGATDWQKYGFDVAYQQPNHFFSPNIPDERIDMACQQAYSNNMGMEMEFDARALADTKDSYRERLITYLDKFEALGVYNESAIAYYEGGGAIIYFAKSKNPKDIELLDRMATLVQKRQKATQ